MNEHKYLAQVNIGKVIAPMDDPIISGFADYLDEINKLAEESEGFVWLLKEDNNNVT